MISTLEHIVHTVRSGESTLSWLQNHTVDLLVLDMDFGIGINGCQTYAKVLEISPTQKSFITSVLAEETVILFLNHIPLRSSEKSCSTGD